MTLLQQLEDGYHEAPRDLYGEMHWGSTVWRLASELDHQDLSDPLRTSLGQLMYEFGKLSGSMEYTATLAHKLLHDDAENSLQRGAE